MDNVKIFQKLKGDGQTLSIFRNISGDLSKIWNYSWIPIILRRKTFSELSRANELALKIISDQYKEGYYENTSHPFTQRVSELPDPEVSIVPFRIDYLKKREGIYAMYDLNTQPGTPGSFFWEEFWQQKRNEEFQIGGERFGFFRIFPVLQEVFQKVFDGRVRVALFQAPDSTMSNDTISGLCNICGKTSSYGYYDIEFVSDKKRLSDYSVIEPFYFIRGDLSKVFTNYMVAVKENKPLGSNLKLEPYTSKDMAFASNMESYLDSEKSSFLKERIALPSSDGGVKKRLYGMSGTGYFDGDYSIPWSDELLTQETLYPENCLVSNEGRVKEMMYDIGITSLMVFKRRELLDFYPVVDVTIRAKKSHPISGPDTNIVPAVVKI